MKVYLLLLLLATGLFLAGCAQTGGQVEREYVCPDVKTIVKNTAQCPPVQAAQQEDPEMKTCEEMPESERVPFADYCYMGLAYKRENATICRKLSESKRLECYYGLAVLKNDVTLCDSAGTQKNYCYSNYATEKGDVTACDKITDINAKDSCYSQYASRYGDSTACEKIRLASNKDSCYMGIASSQCDSSMCDKIANANMKEQCLRNIQYCGGGPPQPAQEPLK
jgi:hypothetical protein